ncbi:MAG TPA: phosphoglycerate mutase family protein [Solirubrobacteraceae bacterium]|nr:phosphoglycerate mutase family protein [Solirubrobacteraceae bacterium]
MAKTLWLLRHGEAEDPGRGSDSDRRLTKRGEDQARAAGRALSRLGVTFELVFASPRVRALDTARIASVELRLEPILHEPLGGDFGADDAAELVAATSDGGALLLVGHEPDMSGLVAAFTGGHVAMKKGGLAAIRLAGRRGELALLLRPREIEFLAAG